MQRNQLGFSLVELLISIALGLVLMTGVVQMFIGSKQSFTSQQGVSRIQETGRLAIEFISRDMRMAGYYGCFTPKDGAGKDVSVVPTGLEISGLQREFNISVRGYKTVSDLPHSAAIDLGATIEAETKTNILVLRGADPQTFIGFANNTANEVYAYSTTDVVDNCVRGICSGSVVVVSDCAKARIFKVSATPTVSNNKMTLKHTESWGGGGNKEVNFGTLSEVSLMKTVVYFIAKGAGGGPSLFRRVNAENAVELVEDVENISFSYGVSGTTYKKAEDILSTEWPKVTAVKIELLVRSNINNTADDKQSYTFNGATVAQADVKDNRIRKVFMATISVRNR